jgi:hypothetical protein
VTIKKKFLKDSSKPNLEVIIPRKKTGKRVRDYGVGELIF